MNDNLMSKVFKLYGDDKKLYGYAVYCPGCKSHHCYYTEKINSSGAKWTFNGDEENPTFLPSMLSKAGLFICHSFITNGKIQYLNDCTHELKGLTIKIEDF